MKRLLIGIVVLNMANLAFAAQTTRPASDIQQASDKIDSTLTALRQHTLTPSAASQRLTETMVTLEIAGHAPRQSDIMNFTNALTDALARTQLNPGELTTIRASLQSVIRDTRTSNFTLAQRLQSALSSLHVTDLQAADVVRRFIAIGEAVRGPDDSPASAVSPE